MQWHHGRLRTVDLEPKAALVILLKIYMIPRRGKEQSRQSLPRERKEGLLSQLECGAFHWLHGPWRPRQESLT